MPTKFKILVGVLAIAVSHDIGRRSANKKLTTASEIIVTLWDDNNVLKDELSYMCHVLSERGITLDEFDLIALPHLTVK